jgi:hypothetical protein
VEIPVRLFEEITGLAELPPPVDEADYERRKHRRIPFGHRAVITPERKGYENEPVTVMVRDMSPAGVAFLHDEAFKIGTPIGIEFKGHQDREVRLHCIVARCEAGGPGGTQFVIGASFDAALTEELPVLMPAKPVAPGLPEANVDESALTLTDEPATPAKVPQAPAPTVAKAEPAPAPSAPAPVIKAKGLFTTTDLPQPSKAFDPYWSEGEPTEPAAAAPAPTPVPEASAPTFRVIPLPDAEPEPEVHTEKESKPHAAPELPPKTNHDVLHRVKEMLVKQERLIETQREELKAQRERIEQLESMRSDLEEANQKLTELQNKSQADDSDIAELANFLKEHGEIEVPDRKNEAA